MLLEIALAVAVVLLLVAAVVAGVLVRARTSMATELHNAKAESESLRETNRELETKAAVAQQSLEETQSVKATADKLRDENTDLVKQVERLTADREALEKLHKKLDDSLAGLATKSLNESNKQFLELAKKTFESEKKDADASLKQRQVAIETLVKPIQEKLQQTTQAINEIEKNRKEAYGGLKQHLAAMVTDQKQLRDETANLVKALRRPEVRGQWGEMQLRRVAELAGMAAHCDFTEQTSVDSGALRPDMIVDLPGGRQIVVDAKTPITAYIDAAEATEDADRDTNLGRHVKHIEEKIAELSSKRYQDHFATADFVVLFIPGESFLYAAASRKPDLIENAMNRNVVIATPTTLISLLKVVALGWREEQLADNAKKIQDLGQELHKRVATLTRHLDNLGKAVGKTVEHYNKFVGSYESQVMVQTRKFQELGADSPKELPAEGEIEIIESSPRTLKAIEE
ncbi:DNA recombination protein RmuC [Algisphaera agarilytica]|uniref:DNA recombination protein RmuC n=1 Tax=Algisphaera agarilytica TaxID=1385975 RepID=A0A7X0H6M3_9BACT|nr:DNA recombination protein RmuC [Algisphaera agarilytica]MBB6430250.1 DNA recombination protein RmuC [Algisphaera agarilytica]